jgi:sugar lactone lactonase YvrE
MSAPSQSLNLGPRSFGAIIRSAAAAILLVCTIPIYAQSRALPPDPPCGVLTQWSLSPPFRPAAFTAEAFPSAKAWHNLAWTEVTSERAGLVDIARLVNHPPEGATRIWARTTLHASQKEVRPLQFGCTDGLSLFLNGQIIFRGKPAEPAPVTAPTNSVAWNDTVFLSLEAGDNELALAISSTAGGWAFMFRDLNSVYLAPGAAQLWELADQFSAPESVAYDAKRDLLYVSNFSGNSIARLRPDGTLLALNWVAGIKNPTGLKIRDDKLYATERAGIAVIDLATGQVTTHFPLPGAKFPNDLAFDESGALYVTDSQANRIYRVRDGHAEVWLQDDAINRPNGIHVDHQRVLVGVTSDGTVKAVDLSTRTISTLVDFGADFYPDGLTADGSGGYLVSDYYGRIYDIPTDGTPRMILDRRGPRHFCADFVYVPETGLLVVPSLFDNRLTAYRLAPAHRESNP